MNSAQRLLSVALVLVITGPLNAMNELPRSTPEAQGIPSEALLRMIKASEADPANAWHGLVVVRRGHVVAEGYWAPYRRDEPHELFSLSKSFTATAVGIASAEGLLDIDTPVLDFFPDGAPAEPGDHLRALHLRQLLTMTTGHRHEPEIFGPLPEDTTLVGAFLAAPVEMRPGTTFLYNTAATYVQSAIVQEVTGQTVRDYLMPRLFAPLGIDEPQWDESRDGVNLGGFGLWLKTRDIARFGQLLMQRGAWDGEPLIDPEWIAEATMKQTSNGSWPTSDWDQGYGFQFWMNTVGGFRGDGAFGQICIVLPEHDLVVAATAAVRDMQSEFRWIWNELLPALSDEPLPANPDAFRELHTKLGSLVLELPEGEADSPMAAHLAGKTYALDPNPGELMKVRFATDRDRPVLTVSRNADATTVPLGTPGWSRVEFPRHPDEDLLPASVASAWTDEKTLELRVAYEGRAQNLWLRFEFAGDDVTIRPEFNVAFGPQVLEPIRGRVDR